MKNLLLLLALCVPMSAQFSLGQPPQLQDDEVMNQGSTVVKPCSAVVVSGAWINNECDSDGNIVVSFATGTTLRDFLCRSGASGQISNYFPGDEITVSSNCDMYFAGQGGSFSFAGTNTTGTIANTSTTVSAVVNLPAATITVPPGQAVEIQT